MLELLPETSLSSSFVVTVWLGVIVICGLNLCFGWTLSGLVVPGLVVPVLMSSPATGVLIVVEAFLTFLIVRYLSKAMPLYLDSSHFFGRDRFFAMIVVSVGVRLLLEAGLSVSPFFSYGYFEPSAITLAVVPLFANQLWKPGFARGLLQSAIALFLTWLLITFILIPVTNFDFNNLALVFDSLNARIDNTPRTYIILITSAYIASRLNLRYGWDMGGILFPALLSLTWFDPLRLLATLVEGAFLYFTGSYILGLPALNSKGFQGATRILFFFNLAFLYRLILGHVFEEAFPYMWGGDAMGIGFLVSALLAIRAYEKKVGFRIIRTVGQVSFLGAAAGFFAAVVSLFVLKLFSAPEQKVAIQAEEARGCTVDPLEHEIRIIENQMPATYLRNAVKYAQAYSESYLPPSGEELQIMSGKVLGPLLQKASLSWQSKKHISATELKKELSALQQTAREIGFSFTILNDSNDPVVVLNGACHRGLMAVRWGAAKHVALMVPRPGVDLGALERAIYLFDDIQARILLTPTAHVYANGAGSSDLTSYGNRRNFQLAALEKIVTMNHRDKLILAEVSTMDIPAQANKGKKFPDYVLSGEDLGNPELIKELKSLSRSFVPDNGTPATAFARSPTLVLGSIISRGGLQMYHVTLSLSEELAIQEKLILQRSGAALSEGGVR